MPTPKSKGKPPAKKTAPRAVAAPSPWILNPLSDSVLFIAAPLVVMAVFLPLRSWFTSQQIAVFLLAFFTFGHHFPGFLRAYGDRELFARYKVRFLLAPPLIFAVALWFDARDLHGLLIFVSMWDIWHVLMQHYGFMRIYDSKAGAISAVTSWLDWAFSISWYLTLIVVSPHYAHNLLSRAYQTGLPLLSTGAMAWLQTGMLSLSALLTLVYAGYHLNLWRQGRPVSLRKVTLLGIFVAATYYLYVYLDDFLVGFTVWSAFHCIQYYGIVWSFNRNRVAKKRPVTAVLRFLFRPRVGLVLLYAGLIMAYGSINYWVSMVSAELLQKLLIAFVVTSNALHYYYDGFIWKVADPDTRRDLNIAEQRPQNAGALVTRAARSLLALNRGPVQAAYLAAILIVLVSFETWHPHDPLEKNRSLASVSPHSGEARYNLGNALWENGQLDEAVENYRAAARLLPESSKVLNNLGGVLYDKGQVEEAIQQFQKALTFHDGEEDLGRVSASPLLPGAAASPAAKPDVVHTNLGDALARSAQPERAVEHYGRAVAINPRSVKGFAGLGATLADLGRFEEGRANLERALTLDPGYMAAHINLASTLAYLGDEEAALIHYQTALQKGDQRAREAAAAGIARLQPQP